MNPKANAKDFWASYNRGDLDETWKTYVAEDIVMYSPAGVESDRDSWLIHIV